MKTPSKVKKLIEPGKTFRAKFKKLSKPKPIAFIVKYIKKALHFVNNAPFGIVFTILCMVIFSAILVANRVTLNHTLISNVEVGNVIVEWNIKFASMCYVSFMLLCQGMWVAIVANRRPRKPQVMKEDDS